MPALWSNIQRDSDSCSLVSFTKTLKMISPAFESGGQRSTGDIDELFTFVSRVTVYLWA